MLFACMEPAHAKTQYYTIDWMIDPILPKLETVTVKPGDVVTEARLLPSGLIAIDSPAVGSDGKVIVSSGAQLLTLSSNIMAACTFTFPVYSDIRNFFVRSSQEFNCFVDEENDGKFESTFKLVSSVIGIPPQFGRIPKKRRSVSPVPYHKIPFSEGTQFPRLRFKYSHQDKLTGHSYFGLCIANGSSKKEPCFDGYSGVRSDKIPKEIGVAGSIAVAIAKKGSLVTLDVKSGLKQMAFLGEERTQFVFY